MFNYKILIVDDEKELAQTLSERLSLRNFDCYVATCAADALTIIHTKHPDLVLLDLRLQDMSGIELISEIKNFDENIKVVFLSGHANEEERQKCLEKGAFDYVLKPVELRKLIKIINEALDVQNHQ